MVSSPVGSLLPLDDAHARVRAVAAAFFRARPLIVAPFFAATVAVLAASGAPTRQVLGLGCGGTLLVGVFLLERRASRARSVGPTWIARSLYLTLAGIGLACVATGGLLSPLLPMVFAPLGVGFAALGETGRANRVYAAFAAVVAVLLALSPRVTSLAPPDTPRRVVLGLALVAASLLLRVGVAGLTQAHARAAETLARAGDELVRGAEARARAVETLGSRVAHEVKNPLAAVRALVELLLESAREDGEDAEDSAASKAGEKTRRRLGVAAHEIARLQEIVEGYAALTRPLDVVRPAPTDVSELVTSLAAMLEARAHRMGAELVVSTDGAASTFPLDRDRVREALLNLALNGLDAVAASPSTSSTSSGASASSLRRGEVRVSASRDASGLTIRVQDTGVGMDEATSSRVGTPFFSLRAGGTGLGAAHARQVAEQHGGHLTYASAPGRGTTATLFFPANARREPHDEGSDR